jgi:hypothetical protein
MIRSHQNPTEIGYKSSFPMVFLRFSGGPHFFFGQSMGFNPRRPAASHGQIGIGTAPSATEGVGTAARRALHPTASVALAAGKTTGWVEQKSKIW